MSVKARFKRAFPFRKDVLALPVADIEQTSDWYTQAFGMKEMRRSNEPDPTVILGRDDVEIGFSINGGDATQDGAAILVEGIERIKEELEASGLKIGDFRVDERDGKKFKVFFVVAPDGLCFYFHQPI